MLNKVLAILLTSAAISGIAFLFWQQELQYQLPTPVPKGYRSIEIGTYISLPEEIRIKNKKPVLIHFFNPECPCSRFNIQHFITLTRNYGGKMEFYAVVSQEGDLESAKELLKDTNVGIVTDENQSLAKKCGVYSTPQAVVIDEQSQLYYRGNYNRARYCTQRQTSYAQMAIEQVISHNPPPYFDTLATRSYGCQLPERN
ncbi:thioredoxin fold domain-containing protein [Cytophagaceae bacterium DM2B3-1]|uniref:Thioredoxin fold domain-containing protein n=1 Tax=Xanthocytophaga flava TaxID=3048013 RepID=A0ABT7CI01_9BACT|nr:thioredoxin fold domain-containing protein [Xanthocytophaga flavus]MDJ1468430.1 thioredoxin fold domain-containing protein [Xanthocytophaga flavus]MDJ1493315.1 thioredoxin fold domain-containing protein [Xanthocytophaga flavus]